MAPPLSVHRVMSQPHKPALSVMAELTSGPIACSSRMSQPHKPALGIMAESRQDQSLVPLSEA